MIGMKNCPDCSTFYEKDGAIDACSVCGLGRTRSIEYDEDNQDYSRQTDDEIKTRKSYFRKLYLTYFKHSVKGKSLDIGCADTLFVDVLLSYGWDASGIDPYRNLGIQSMGRIRRLSLDNMPCDDRYDLITMVHSFEHMPDPNKALNICRELLTNYGKILIVVPNFGGVWSSMLGEAWDWRAIEHHCFHYTRQSIENILVNNGFKVARVRTHSGYAPSPLQIRLSLRDFYCKPLVRFRPVSSAIYRTIRLFRPMANRIVDKNLAGAEIQIMAVKD